MADKKPDNNTGPEPYENRSAEEIRFLIQIAAAIVKRPAKELTFPDAMKILKDNDIDIPAREEEERRAKEELAAIYNLDREQLEPALLEWQSRETRKAIDELKDFIDNIDRVREAARKHGAPEDFSALEEEVRAWIRALEEDREQLLAEGRIKGKPALPTISTAPLEELMFPVDKVNNEIWKLLEEAGTDGQIAMEISTAKKGSRQKAIVYYSINFSDIDPRLAKRLTPFDKRVYIAATGLYNAGYEYFTVSQIYYEMGNTTRPNTTDIKKINDSLTKMRDAIIHIDNEKETLAQKKRQHFKYDSSLLPFERTGAYINNQLVESAVHLFREPPVSTFARERNQVTTISPLLLKSPISKTDANLRIDDYLIDQIAHMKRNKKYNRLMLYETIFEKCAITQKKQKQRAPEKIKTYLEHYQQTGWIRGYNAEARSDGIIILL